MKTITEILLPLAHKMDTALVEGARDWEAGGSSRNLRTARMLYVDHRSTNYGFEPIFQPLLTAPAHNAKLAKGSVPSYGLTLQHYVQRITKRLIVNACPHAGDCTKVCVLDNGHGSFETVQRGRRSKTAFLVQQPWAFAYLLGRELARAQAARPILFRPNVNSDVRWDLILPSLFSGTFENMTSYGYTKDPFVLDTNGWVTPSYRLAYSWNENSRWTAVETFIYRGGSVAMVTARKKGAPVGSYITPLTRVVDADLTDEWMFQAGVIGDLSAKGRARRLIGKSGFVVTTGAAA